MKCKIEKNCGVTTEPEDTTLLDLGGRRLLLKD